MQNHAVKLFQEGYHEPHKGFNTVDIGDFFYDTARLGSVYLWVRGITVRYTIERIIQSNLDARLS